METPPARSPLKTCPNAPLKRTRSCMSNASRHTQGIRDVHGMFVDDNTCSFFHIDDLQDTIQEKFPCPVSLRVEIPIEDAPDLRFKFFEIWYDQNDEGDVNKYMENLTGYEWRGPAIVVQLKDFSEDPEYLSMLDPKRRREEQQRIRKLWLE